jgi:hypothetical protein
MLNTYGNNSLPWLEINKIIIPEVSKVEAKFGVFDTMSVLKNFAENCQNMINNIKKVNATTDDLEKICIDLNKNNLKSVDIKEYFDVIISYNGSIEKSEVLHDSLAMKVLIPLLLFERPDIGIIDRSRKISNFIYERFYYSTNYHLLHINSKNILNHINRYISEREELEKIQKTFLSLRGNSEAYSFRMTGRDSIVIALKILLSDKEERAAIAKDTILEKYIGKQYYLHALLGNKIAEEDLILSHKYNTRFDERRKFIRQMVFINSPKTINAVLESFNDDVYDISCPASIRIPIINEMSRLYPQEPILRKMTNPKIKESFFSFGAPKPEPEWTLKYVESVLDWIKNEFGIIPSGDNKSLQLYKNGRGCGGRVGS